MGKKKFKDTKLGNILSNKLPSILAVAGEFLPDKGALGIIKNMVTSDKSMSEQDRAEILALINEHEIALAKEDTERIKSFHSLENTQLQQEDMFTKRARPTRQYFWLLFILFCYPVMYLIQGKIMDLPEVILFGIFTDFGLYTWKRTEEKNKKFENI